MGVKSQPTLNVFKNNVKKMIADYKYEVSIRLKQVFEKHEDLNEKQKQLVLRTLDDLIHKGKQRKTDTKQRQSSPTECDKTPIESDNIALQEDVQRIERLKNRILIKIHCKIENNWERPRVHR